jgi:hypothetical protein
MYATRPAHHFLHNVHTLQKVRDKTYHYWLVILCAIVAYYKVSRNFLGMTEESQGQVSRPRLEPYISQFKSEALTLDLISLVTCDNEAYKYS